MSNAVDILTRAAKIVGGARNVTHGTKERSFQVIADLWNAYLQGRQTVQISPRDVAQLMVLMKVGRSLAGDPIEDHFLDAAGYAAIAGELAAKEMGTWDTVLATQATDEITGVTNGAEPELRQVRQPQGQVKRDLNGAAGDDQGWSACATRAAR